MKHTAFQKSGVLFFLRGFHRAAAVCLALLLLLLQTVGEALHGRTHFGVVSSVARGTMTRAQVVSIKTDHSPVVQAVPSAAPHGCALCAWHAAASDGLLLQASAHLVPVFVSFTPCGFRPPRGIPTRFFTLGSSRAPPALSC